MNNLTSVILRRYTPIMDNNSEMRCINPDCQYFGNIEVNGVICPWCHGILVPDVQEPFSTPDIYYKALEG